MRFKFLCNWSGKEEVASLLHQKFLKSTVGVCNVDYWVRLVQFVISLDQDRYKKLRCMQMFTLDSVTRGDLENPVKSC